MLRSKASREALMRRAMHCRNRPSTRPIRQSQSQPAGFKFDHEIDFANGWVIA